MMGAWEGGGEGRGGRGEGGEGADDNGRAPLTHTTPHSSGGVELLVKDGKIKCTNTLESRLELLGTQVYIYRASILCSITFPCLFSYTSMYLVYLVLFACLYCCFHVCFTCFPVVLSDDA